MLGRRARRFSYVVLGLVIPVCASYLVDFAWLRYRSAKQDAAFGQVRIHNYFAVPRKDGKEEFMDDEPRLQACVKSLYPHSALPPCWYVERHRDHRIDL